MLKRLVVVSALVGVVAATVISARSFSSDAMKSIVAAYLEIQTQLFADKTDTVKTQAHAIGAQASAMGGAGSAIASAAADVEKAADLKAARDAFGPLSEAVIDAAKKDGWTDVSALKLAYCPMAKRSWLQSGSNVQNPYVGKSMSSCGEFRKMQ